MASALRGIILRRIRGGAAQILTLRSITSHVFNQSDRTEDQINSISSYIIESVDHNIKTRPSNLGIVEGAYDMIQKTHKFKAYPAAVQMRAMSRVLDVVQNYPDVDSLEVFRVRMYIRLKTSNDADANKGDITKDQVISRVLDVIKFYPKIDQSKVLLPYFLMKEGHFDKDLGLDEETWNEIVLALEAEFRLGAIPHEITTCKLVVDYIYETIRSLSSQGDPSVDQIISLASLVIKIVDNLINYVNSCDDPDSDDDAGFYIPVKALSLIGRLPTFKTYPVPAKLRLISTVFDHIQNHPQVENWKVYHVRIYIRSMSIDDGKDDITKDQVISRVLDVIKNNPKVIDPSKVMEESHFHKDLGLNKRDRIAVLFGLALEFKLDIPDEIDSCKRAIDYIYDNRMERLSLKEFDENIGFGLVSC